MKFTACIVAASQSSVIHCMRIRFSPAVLSAPSAVWLLTVSAVHAGETYFTGFESPPFGVGDDKIAGTDGWTGSHAGLKLHGILAESSHGVLQLGNAAVLGGNQQIAASTTKSVYVRRAVNLDPLALNQEVVTFRVACGVKDSSTVQRRDNFEFCVYNANSTPQLLGGIQFDNTTLDTYTLKPQRLLYRLAWNGTSFQYLNTGSTFLPDTLETLEYRINFRTNRWSASLGGVPLFQDLTFYTGSSAKTLGSVVVQMKVTNINPLNNYLMPGDNYLLFDGYSVRTDAVTTAVEVSRNRSGQPVITWNEEAGYSYVLQRSDNLTTWTNAISRAASATADFSHTDATAPVPARRYYRVKRSYP